jgi:hypothetical protein
MTTGLTHWEKKADGARTQEVVAIQSPLLSIAEAVAYLRLGQSTIYERLNHFEVVRLGRRLFITRASADHYIRASFRRLPKCRHRADVGRRPRHRCHKETET